MTLPYIIAAVVILHFLIGIGYLIYKINTAKPTKKFEEKVPQEDLEK